MTNDPTKVTTKEFGLLCVPPVVSATVRRWRMLEPDFPKAIYVYGDTPVYDVADALAWLHRHNYRTEGDAA